MSLKATFILRDISLFPLIKLAKKLKDDSNGILGSATTAFPLIKLAKKLKVDYWGRTMGLMLMAFPLIKLAKKLKDQLGKTRLYKDCTAIFRGILKSIDIINNDSQ